MLVQIDFKTKLLCSIQKGIVQRQLPFSLIKSWDDAAGSRFSISFKGHHDYELEATSLEDKHKVKLHCVCVCVSVCERACTTLFCAGNVLFYEILLLESSKWARRDLHLFVAAF